MKSASLAAGVAAAAGGVYLLELARTGVPELDRLGVRGRVVLQALRHFGPRAVSEPRLVRALMAIVHNESRGSPRNVLGDTAAAGGPSIGLMQVYRTTAEGMKLWTPPPGASTAEAKQAYAAMASNEGQGIAWGVAVFKDKLRLAKGNVVDAIRRYNGSGPSAEAYRDKALKFAEQRGWVLS